MPPGPCEGAQGLVKVTAAQRHGVSNSRAPGLVTGHVVSMGAAHPLMTAKARWAAQGWQSNSKMTNPLGVLSSPAFPACPSVLTSLINSMPIFRLSHSSFLVLTFLTFICWLRVGFSLCFSLWRKQADTGGDVEKQGRHRMKLDLGTQTVASLNWSSAGRSKALYMTRDCCCFSLSPLTAV